MKTITIYGVPYSVNEKNELFLYSSSPPVHIGTYDSEKAKVNLFADWKTKSEEYVKQYRASLFDHCKVALEKAVALQNS